jgi:ArsR family transcriptional regulator
MATTTALEITRSCCSPSCTEGVARTRFDDARLTEQERALAALADPTRLRMLHLLSRHDSLCVCEIEAAFDLGQPTISHHLKLLREAGLVTVERRGTWAYYAVARPAVKELASDLSALA